LLLIKNTKTAFRKRKNMVSTV